MLSRDVSERVLVVGFGRELVQGLFEEKEMAEDEGVARGYGLWGKGSSSVVGDGYDCVE